MMDTPENASRALSLTVARRLSAAGISQRSAAETTGIPLTTLSRRLTGFSPLKATELVVLAGLLRTTVSDLVKESEASINVRRNVTDTTAGVVAS